MFSDDQFLDAALQLLAEDGPAGATVSRIAGAVGAPVGSAYHRFESRDLLLARLWVRTVADFQEGFLAALAEADVDAAARNAALHSLRWSRDHLPDAKLLMLHRPGEVIARWPDEVGARLSQLNARVDDAIRDHARRRFGTAHVAHQRRVRFAVVDVPYSACRRSLVAGVPPPAMMDDLVARCVRAVLVHEDGMTMSLDEEP